MTRGDGGAQSATDRVNHGMSAPALCTSDSYLLPGQLRVGEAPQGLSTILGSCVAVCLYDPRLRSGGMNHFLLPGPAPTGESPLRYGLSATGGLIEALLQRGSRKGDLVAKVFGGANVSTALNGSRLHLGDRNIEMAREILERERIPLVSNDVGGRMGRRILFCLGDGSVWVRRLGEAKHVAGF